MFYQGRTVNETEEFRQSYSRLSSSPFNSVSTKIRCYRGKKDLNERNGRQDRPRMFMDEDQCKFKDSLLSSQFFLRANSYLSNVLHFMPCRGGPFEHQIPPQIFTSSTFHGLLQSRIRCGILFRSHWTQSLSFMEGECEPNFHSSQGAPLTISCRSLQGVEKRWDLRCFCQDKLLMFYYSGVRPKWFTTRMTLSFMMFKPYQISHFPFPSSISFQRHTTALTPLIGRGPFNSRLIFPVQYMHQINIWRPVYTFSFEESY